MENTEKKGKNLHNLRILMTFFKKKKLRASSAAGLLYPFLAEKGEAALVSPVGDMAGSRDPSVIWVWAMIKSKLFLEWEAFSRDGEERRARELSSSCKVGGGKGGPMERRPRVWKVQESRLE